jgi:integral membrane protein (TIGR01906 family)
LSKNRTNTFIRWLIVIAIPLLLTVATLRLVISWDQPSYPEFEYKRIQPDRFGFSDEQRQEFAEATLAYLRRSEPAGEVIYLLEEMRLPNSDQPFYNTDEIGHMLDVKRVSDVAKIAMWFSVAVVAAGLIYLLSRTETRQEGYKAIMYGGILTAVILVVMAVLILLSWNLVFTQFHELLFPPGTWTFSFSDSLIRLFPEQFWFDFGLIWVVGILVQGLFLALIGYLLLRRSRSSK